MQKQIVNIALIVSLMLFTNAAVSQNVTAQERYYNSSQQKHNFNNEKWNGLKETIKNESGGKFSSESESSEGSFYQYDKEGYDGAYGEYKNDDEVYSSEGDGGGSDSERGANYHPKKNKTKYGEESFHPKKQTRHQKKDRKTNNSTGEGYSMLTYLLFGVVVVLLAFLIYHLFMKSTLDTKGSKVVSSFEDIEPTQIPKSELELLLEKAITDDDYRKAIRIYFIFIIKELSEKKWIRWEKKKTNFSYLIEMRNKPHYDSFNDAIAIYELVWYGNYAVEKNDFTKLEPRFKALLNNIKTHSI